MIIWFTGQPGSGKTTLATLLLKVIQEELYVGREDKVVNIDGDGLRKVFNNFDYSPEGRDRNITMAVNTARWLHSQGFFVIVSLVSPYRKHREDLKKSLPWCDVLEVYLSNSEIRGREKFHVKDYEMPDGGCLVLDTELRSEDECVYILLEHINACRER